MFKSTGYSSQIQFPTWTCQFRTICNFSLRESNILLASVSIRHSCVHRHICRQNTKTHKIKINKNIDAKTAAAVQRNLDYLEVATKKLDTAFECIAIQYIMTLWKDRWTYACDTACSHEDNTKLFQILALTQISIISGF